MTELTPRPTAHRDHLTEDGQAPVLPRRDPITELPIIILHVHSRCNCRCVMCDIWQDTRRQEITAAEVAGWLPEWKALGVARVILSGGEPLMHSHLWDLCGELRSAGLGITTITTGLLLKRSASSLVQYCDDVVVSLDGPESVHDRIRNVPGAFQRLSDGVAAVRGADRSVRLTGRCTVQRLNFRTLRDTVSAARDIGLDAISFLAADVSTEAFNRPDGWPPDRAATVALNRDEIPELRAELEALEQEHTRDFHDGFIVESPAKLRRRLLQYFEALVGSSDFAPNYCNAPWVSTVVETDGTVRPCFFHAPLGNVREAGSIAKVLNSDTAVGWRQSLDVARNEICRRCVCTLALRQGHSGVQRYGDHGHAA